ncbi:hypothetical protein [Ensifer adhaerens]|uniref:hypothetical protein n=1 Tax=Ensifer adhaerens TaxID=106592 RepID=UPI001319E1E0|nr:hypothetical protein [Ensifer adhaerens]
MSVAAPQPNPTRIKGRLLPWAGALLLCATAAASALYYLTGAREPSSEIAAVAATGADGEAPMVRPPSFEILFSDGDRGLMVYEGYVYVVRLGDKMPNGRRMIGFQKRDGNWAAVTL